MEAKELQAHLNGLIAFEISIDRIDAAYKLSQNRSDRDYQEIIERLRASGDPLDQAIAEDMKKMRSL